MIPDTRLPCGLLLSQLSELLDRDITPNDYEILLQLDESVARPTASKAGVEGLMVSAAKEFLGGSCVVCQSTFEPEDIVVALRCGHHFHSNCISKWLLERCQWCPLCGADALPCP